MHMHTVCVFVCMLCVYVCMYMCVFIHSCSVAHCRSSLTSFTVGAPHTDTQESSGAHTRRIIWPTSCRGHMSFGLLQNKRQVTTSSLQLVVSTSPNGTIPCCLNSSRLVKYGGFPTHSSHRTIFTASIRTFMFQLISWAFIRPKGVL
jgi:hypothetical protein